MSSPIIKDNLYVVLSGANNWESKGELVAPIVNANYCRILSNQNAIIQASFIRDSFVLDSTQTTTFSLPGLCYAGDDKTWFPVKDKYIHKPIITLYSNITFDSLAICFQFI